MRRFDSCRGHPCCGILGYSACDADCIWLRDGLLRPLKTAGDRLSGARAGEHRFAQSVRGPANHGLLSPGGEAGAQLRGGQALGVSRRSGLMLPAALGEYAGVDRVAANLVDQRRDGSLRLLVVTRDRNTEQNPLLRRASPARNTSRVSGRVEHREPGVAAPHARAHGRVAVDGLPTAPGRPAPACSVAQGRSPAGPMSFSPPEDHIPLEKGEGHGYQRP